MDLQVDAQGAHRAVHVYEAYWAPATEGRVTLRDVVRFLVMTGWRSLRLGSRPFKRWLFDQYLTFPAPVRTTIYLGVALAVVVALVLVEALIVALAAARLPFTTPPPRLSEALFADITAILNPMNAVFAIFGALIWILDVEAGGVAVLAPQRGAAAGRRLAALARLPVRHPLGVRGGVRRVDLGRHCGRAGRGAGAREITGIARRAVAARHAAGRASARGHRGRDHRRDDLDGGGACSVPPAAVAGPVCRGRFDLSLRPSARAGAAPAPDRRDRARTVVVLLLGGAMIASLAALGLALMRTLDVQAIGVRRLRDVAPWALTIATAAIVRSFLIQYVGDVAAYVESQSLDRFAALRQHIKDLVVRRARAVYSFAEYDDVIVAGHSLGSVVAYDALNQLLLEEAQVPGAPTVAQRTRLLLTFGSPLDKTAYLFGTLGPGARPARRSRRPSSRSSAIRRSARPGSTSTHRGTSSADGWCSTTCSTAATRGPSIIGGTPRRKPCSARMRNTGLAEPSSTRCSRRSDDIGTIGRSDDRTIGRSDDRTMRELRQNRNVSPTLRVRGGWTAVVCRNDSAGNRILFDLVGLVGQIEDADQERGLAGAADGNPFATSASIVSV